MGQSQWVRGRNTSESFGPAEDHTVGTELGEAAHQIKDQINIFQLKSNNLVLSVNIFDIILTRQ